LVVCIHHDGHSLCVIVLVDSSDLAYAKEQPSSCRPHPPGLRGLMALR
ncbi:unnamed protein product, partial [Urochloa humidicola]